jgi:ABC-type lipoprotein export system ATPase subunit
MTKIIIQNVGPISNIEMELNKINVIMGPQSCGKSTIAKIVSYCQWVEKRYILDGKYEEDISKQLLNFHHLDKNYFVEKSFFGYESDFITITYKGKDLEEFIQLKQNTNTFEYEKSKNIYIPAERNFVSVIPNLGKYNETNDNIMSFLYDWYTAKRKYTKQNSLPVLKLGVDFYNNQAADSDVLVLNENNKEILLSTSSSGLQSITPLVLIVEYLTNIIYNEDHTLSMNEIELIKEIVNKKNVKIYENRTPISKGLIEDSIKEDVSILVSRRKSYHKTNFIIEEPEQNLFPETQRDLIYFLFNKLQSEKDHSLLITTHSPYILYAINNCMMADIVKDKISEQDKQRLKQDLTPINPQKVSIYQIHKGKLNRIQQKDGLIGDNYFDDQMKKLMDDFYILLNYYGNDKNEY